MQKTINVTIEGTRAILLHNPASMGAPAGAAGKKNIPTAEDEAKTSCYWTEDGKSLAFPGLNIHRGMIKAAGAFRAGRLSMTPYIAGGIEILPELVPFNRNTYQIDTRRAVIQRQGIMRSRAKIPAGWRLSFQLLVSEDDLPQKSMAMLRAMLEELGRRIGIGDFRPEKTGPFGKFVVTVWDEA